MPLRTKHVGALLGLGFGWVVIHYGWLQAIFVAVATGLGWTLGRILDGELDISGYIRRPNTDEWE